MKHEIDLNIHTSMVNEYDHFTPQGYEELFMQILEYHLYHINTQKMIDDRVSWVLMSMAIEVRQYFHRGDHLRAEIFDSGLVGPIVRKEIGIYRKGELVLTAVAFLGLMDLNIRRLYRGPLEYYCGKIEFHEPLMEANSRVKVDFSCEGIDEYNDVLIKPSCIDALGHCNNEHYFAMMYNALDEKHQSMEGFRRLESSFLHEVRKHDRLRVYGVTNGNVCEIQGIREDGSVSFVARLHFEE